MFFLNLVLGAWRLVLGA